MNEDRYLLFDQYLQNELSGEDKINFEKQLSTDPEFASAFETFKGLNAYLENKFGNADEFDAFSENLGSVADAHFKTDKPKVIAFKPWRYLVAASIVLLVGLFFLIQHPNPNFEDYNQHENAYFTERGNANATLKLAEEAFNAKNYKEAIPAFEKILENKKKPEIQYFYAISLLEDNQFPAAEAVFNELKSNAPVYKDKALWYLALSRLKQKDYKGCEEILKTIPSDFEDFDQVQELLDALD